MRAWDLGRPAGFWIRTAAIIIDNVLLTIVTIVIIATVILVAMALQQNYFETLGDETVWTAGWTAGDTLNTLHTLLIATYGILMVAAFSGTVGKLVLGMRIVRTDGSRVSLGRAALRYVAQILSVLTLFIGYLMVAFRKDKRSLHDIIADTAVIIVRK